VKERLREIVRAWLGPQAELLAAKPLEGGWINEVLEIEVDREPFRAVVKLSKPLTSAQGVQKPVPHCSFAEEAECLRYLRRETDLRVPDVYLVDEQDRGRAFIVIERLPGSSLEHTDVPPDQRAWVERRIADDLLELHSHGRDSYGLPHESKATWLDVFEPMIRYNFAESRPLLSKECAEIVPKVLVELPRAMRGCSGPTLIHGDAWAGNIMVHCTDGRWDVSGWVDPGLMFADVELELAYLSVFGTAGPAFFERYDSKSPPRPGASIRRLFYWLNTMLVHAWVFEYPRYMERADSLARELAVALDRSS